MRLQAPIHSRRDRIANRPSAARRPSSGRFFRRHIVPSRTADPPPAKRNPPLQISIVSCSGIPLVKSSSHPPKPPDSRIHDQTSRPKLWITDIASDTISGPTPSPLTTAILYFMLENPLFFKLLQTAVRDDALDERRECRSLISLALCFICNHTGIKID